MRIVTHLIQNGQGKYRNQAVTQCNITEIEWNLTCKLIVLKLIRKVATQKVNHFMHEYKSPLETTRAAPN